MWPFKKRPTYMLGSGQRRLSLEDRVAAIEMRLTDDIDDRLSLEKKRSHLYFERNSHLEERIRHLTSENRRLNVEVELGTRALRDAVSPVVKQESPPKEQELEPVRKRVSDMGRRQGGEDD